MNEEYKNLILTKFGSTLKIMAEIHDVDNTKWGLFFEGQSGFKHLYLILLDISEERLDVMGKPILEKKTAIFPKEIVIKNSGKSLSTKWGYYFQENDSDLENDIRLNLTGQFPLIGLSDEGWPKEETVIYWKSKNIPSHVNRPILTIGLPNPIIGGWEFKKFDASVNNFQHPNNIPRIEIGITKEFFKNETSLARTWHRSEPSDFDYFPFLSISNFLKKNSSREKMVNFDLAIKWFDKKWKRNDARIGTSPFTRHDNVLDFPKFLELSPENLKSGYDLINKFSDRHLHFQFDTKRTPPFHHYEKRIEDNLRDTNNESIFYSFFKQKVGNLLELIPIYIYSYKWSINDLRSITGNSDLGIDPKKDIIPTIHVIQKCLLDSDNILIHVGQISRKNINLLQFIWNKRVEILSNSIGNISSARPVALFPEIELWGDGNFTYVQEWKVERETGVKSLVDFCFFPNQDGTSKLTIKQFPYQKHLSPNERFALEITNLNLDLSTKKQTEKSTQIKNANIASIFEFTPFIEKNQKLNIEGMKTITDGAIRIELNDEYKNNDIVQSIGYFALKLQWIKSQRPFYLWEWGNQEKSDRLVPAFYIQDLLLPIKSVQAAGQDKLPGENLLSPTSLEGVLEGAGERTEPPLLIPIPNKNVVSEETAESDADKPKRFLSISESINVGQDHRLTLKIIQLNNEYGAKNESRVNAVIIDSNPQFIALVNAKFLQQSGFDDGAWVLAVRDAEDGWRFLDDNASTEGFHLVLPSQAIGEAYVKNGEDGEPKENQPIDFRFGAPAIINLAPERLDKRYVNAPWNLRRIWGIPGEVSPGLPLLEAQFELLYGLQGNLKPENALLAELASKLGEVPVPPINTIVWNPTQIQNAEYQRKYEEYVKFFRTWKSRLAILEPSKEDEFQNATFDRNIIFKPRVELLKIESENEPNKLVGARLKWPIKQKENEPKNDNLLELHDSGGLAGGFHYGFESAAVYEEFWREPRRSSSAELEAPAFSSMGGWGKQTARFANDKTVIKSITTMGRTHYYAVERIGRIGVFWHKAKHVIEYERTVVPSEQFTSQPPHLGRPLVRKVREFIEILEPERRYPDFDSSEIDAPGSVLACHFQSKIIPILSSWGRDVRRAKTGLIGWEVPLWMPGANPAIYPKPQIQLELTPPPDSDEKSIRVNLTEPENLYFYTDTRESVGGIPITASNVHQWPRVRYVDFSPIPEPVPYDVPPHFGNDPDDIDRELPGGMDIPPGFERFTFRVDSHGLPAAVARRYYSDSAISGTLRTVSMQRGSVGLKGQNLPQNAAKALIAIVGKDSLVQKYANGFKDIEKKIILGQGKFDEFKDNIENSINELNQKLDGLNEIKVKLNHFDTLWNSTNNSLSTFPAKYLWKETLESADGMVNRIMDFYDRESFQLYKELQTGLSDAPKKFNRFIGRIKEFNLGLEFSLDSAHSALLKSINHPLNQLEDNVEELFSGVIEALEQIQYNPSEFDKRISEVKKNYDSKYNSLNNKLFGENGLVTKWEAESSPSSLKEIASKIKEFFDQPDFSPDKVKDKLDQINSNLSNFQKVKREFEISFQAYRIEVKSEINKIRVLLNQPLGIGVGFIKKINKDLFILKKNLINQVEDVEGKTLIEIRKSIVGRESACGIAIKNLLIIKIKEEVLYIKNNDPETVICIFDLIIKADDIFIEFEEYFKPSLINTFSENKIEEWLKTLDSYNRLESLIENSKENIDAILQESRNLADQVNREFGRLAGEVAEKIKELDEVVDTAEDLQAAGAQTLRNFRSVWDEFTAPGMGFNRRTIALLVRTDYNDIQERLSLTPVMGRVNQLNNQLAGLGIRLPSVAITDRLIPAKKSWNDFKNSQLQNFDLSNIFSDIGGMRFDRMFPGLKIPEAARDAIKVTQGFDKQKLMAWVNAEANFPMPPSSKLLNFGPLLVSLENARLTGFSRLEAGENGVSNSNYGELSATWNINVGGIPLMLFKDTKVIFKNGKTTIDLDPKRMEMPGLLDLIYKATANIPLPKDPELDTGPFKVGLHKVKGVPAGILAAINTPPISVGGGPTAMTNLSFGAHFLLAFLDDKLDFKFKTSFGFNIGTKEAPFNLTLFILGGGGYISFKTDFVPEKRISDGLEVFFALSIHASAGIAIALGPIKGNIHIFLGIEGSYIKKRKDGGKTHFTVFFMVNGTVNIMNLVTVQLILLLQLTYNSSNGLLIGEGRISITIRKSRFLKIKVKRNYRKVLSGKKGSNKSGFLANQNDITSRANRILSTLN